MEYTSMDEIRADIDQLDEKLVELVAQRGRCVKAAARFKQNTQAVRAPERVKQVIDKVKTHARRAGLPEEIIEKTYLAMINAFIEYELVQHNQLK
ncbi:MULTISPECIES: chorismate mutase [Serratia]|uniref:chorismate mutase n=1 Tax=Serratia TaxID=613 RepID=UPI00103733C0|nr:MULTISPECIES: chorismate mutase [Serratia]MBH2772226.1 chorismate mutase [Serratia marcescens]TBU67904.1 chorismate mutase [Serratia marcescens]TXE65559.1 chorismate mutase [Serratia nematodiphila]WGL93426.1 chorismate mutase [Serratia marcescens]WJD90243.1 chorismate mutase [Serratia marcescens]